MPPHGKNEPLGRSVSRTSEYLGGGGVGSQGLNHVDPNVGAIKRERSAAGHRLRDGVAGIGAFCHRKRRRRVLVCHFRIACCRGQVEQQEQGNLTRRRSVTALQGAGRWGNRKRTNSVAEHRNWGEGGSVSHINLSSQSPETRRLGR